MSQIQVPYGDMYQTAWIPDSIPTQVIAPECVPVTTPVEALIEEALEQPIGALKLEELVKPEDAGMSNAIAQFLVSIIPESLSRYLAVIIALLSAPGTYVLNQDAFYYGVLPPLAATAEAYGFTGLQIGVASLMGQAFHFLSPLVAFIYLLMDMCKISLAEYQAYICRWCIGIFVIFMVCGMGLGFIPIL